MPVWDGASVSCEVLLRDIMTFCSVSMLYSQAGWTAASRSPAVAWQDLMSLKREELSSA